MKKYNNKIPGRLSIFGGVLGLALLTLWGCGKDSTSVAVTGVTLDKANLSITTGAMATLTATVAPANATNKSVTWSTSDATIAKVDKGVVTGVKAGSATITVSTTDGNKTSKSTVTVTDATPAVVTVTGVTVTSAGGAVIGTPLTLTATVQPDDASQAVTWAITDAGTTGATITDGNVFKATAAGSAKVTATSVADATKSSTQTIAVSATATTATGVTVAPKTATISVGGTQTLAATVAPPNVTNNKVTWSSSPTSVATVDANGVVTGVAAGTATITVTTADGSNKTDTSVITVQAATTATAVMSVTLDATTATLTLGGTTTKQLTATVNPANATNKNVTWSSSDASKATVSASGLVTAVAAGTATITVTTADGNKTASCTVTVSTATVAVTGVTVSPTTATLTLGGTTTQQLTATVSPTNATNTNVTWGSSDTSKATVSASGLVTAVAAGTATITVTTADGNKTASCTVTVNDRVYTAAGLQSKTIPNSAISASSFYDGYPAANGRLNNPNWAYWSAASGSGATETWWQVDLGVIKWVGKFAVQGMTEINYYIKTYKLQYSSDGSTWTNYNNSEVIPGLTSQSNAVITKDLTPFKARYVRIVVLTFQGLPAGKFEVYVSD